MAMGEVMINFQYLQWKAVLGDFKSGWQQTLRRWASGKDHDVLTQESPHFFSGALKASYNQVFVDLDLELDIPWESTRAYRYSKLYFARYPYEPFSEDRVVYFRIERNCSRHKIRVRLPDSAIGEGRIKFRFDRFLTLMGGPKFMTVYSCRRVIHKPS